MALSMSVSAGAHNARHNTDLAYRANLRNVDADLSVGNISIRDVPIAEAYVESSEDGAAHYLETAKHLNEYLNDHGTGR